MKEIEQCTHMNKLTDSRFSLFKMTKPKLISGTRRKKTLSTADYNLKEKCTL